MICLAFFPSEQSKSDTVLDCFSSFLHCYEENQIFRVSQWQGQDRGTEPHSQRTGRGEVHGPCPRRLSPRGLRSGFDVQNRFGQFVYSLCSRERPHPFPQCSKTHDRIFFETIYQESFYVFEHVNKICFRGEKNQKG